MSFKSAILVILQFSCIGYFFVSGQPLAENNLLLLIEGIGIFIGFWAIYNMRISRLRIQPDVHPDAVFVQKGIYKNIRHPMYLAVLLTLLPLLFDYFTFLRLVVYIILILNLIVKIYHEEALLKEHFMDYERVNKKTSRLIPFLW